MSWTQSQLTKLKEDAFKFGIELNEKQLHQFIKYYELLVEWNSFMNLTAITEFEAVCTKHFIDSISLCKAVDCTKEYHVIDIGTGAGFPGIPLKIAFPNLKITLLDSLGKRVNFLNAVITELGLQEIEAIHGRAEDFAKTGVLRETFDICVSRAVANLSILSEYCLPYVKVGGYFISYKSEKVTEEIRMAQNAIQILGGEVSVKKVFLLPNSDIYRNLLMIKKSSKYTEKVSTKGGASLEGTIIRYNLYE